MSEYKFKVGDKVLVVKGHKALGPSGNHFITQDEQDCMVWDVLAITKNFVCLGHTPMEACGVEYYHSMCVHPDAVRPNIDERQLKREGLLKELADIDRAAQNIRDQLSKL